jgi:hypothetical protein
MCPRANVIERKHPCSSRHAIRRRDRASARVASGSSGHAAGAGSIPGIHLRLSPGLAFRIKFIVKGTAMRCSRCLPSYDSFDDIWRTRSSTLCIVIGLACMCEVSVVCVDVCVCVLEYMLHCTQMRGLKKISRRRTCRTHTWPVFLWHNWRMSSIVGYSFSQISVLYLQRSLTRLILYSLDRSNIIRGAAAAQKIRIVVTIMWLETCRR